MWGMRLECRYILYGPSPELAVSSVLHNYGTDLSALENFVVTPDVTWHVHQMTYDEFAQLIRARFAMAHEVHRKVFYGRDNGAPPSPWVFPLLADLANALGFHNGQWY